MRKLGIGIAAILIAVVSVLSPGTTSHVQASSSGTYWVNDSSYSGGGFHLDPLSCQVWNEQNGWHYRPTTGSPLWVNAAYGPVESGGGFYWDPISCQVWTSGSGWHVYNPAGVWPDSGPTQPAADPCAKSLALGDVVQVQPGCFVAGDIMVGSSPNGPWDDLKFDDHPKTGTILIVTNPVWVAAEYGSASVQSLEFLVDSIHAMRAEGCDQGCDWINITTR